MSERGDGEFEFWRLRSTRRTEGSCINGRGRKQRCFPTSIMELRPKERVKGPAEMLKAS